MNDTRLLKQYPELAALSDTERSSVVKRAARRAASPLHRILSFLMVFEIVLVLLFLAALFAERDPIPLEHFRPQMIERQTWLRTVFIVIASGNAAVMLTALNWWQAKAMRAAMRRELARTLAMKTRRHIAGDHST